MCCWAYGGLASRNAEATNAGYTGNKGLRGTGSRIPRQEYPMSKDKNRGNREAKKPKKAKPTAPVATSIYADRKPAGMPSAGRKKG